MGDIQTLVDAFYSEGVGGPNNLGAGAANLIQASLRDYISNSYQATQVHNPKTFEAFRNWAGLSCVQPCVTKTYRQDHALHREATNYLQNLLVQKITQNSRVLLIGSSYSEAKWLQNLRPDLRFFCQISDQGLKQRLRLDSNAAQATSDATPLAIEYNLCLDDDYYGHFAKMPISKLPKFPFDYILAIDSILYIHPNEIYDLMKSHAHDYNPILLASMHHCFEALTIDRDITHPDMGWAWKHDPPYMSMTIDGSNSSPYEHEYAKVEAWWSCDHSLTTDVIYDKWGYGAFRFGIPTKDFHTVTPLRSLTDYFCFLDPLLFWSHGIKNYWIVTASVASSFRQFVFQRLCFKPNSDNVIDWSIFMTWFRANKGKFSMLNRTLTEGIRVEYDGMIPLLCHFVLQLSMDRGVQKVMTSFFVQMNQSEFYVPFFRKWWAWPINRIKTWFISNIRDTIQSEMAIASRYNMPGTIERISSIPQLKHAINVRVDYSSWLLVGGLHGDKDTHERYTEFLKLLNLPNNTCPVTGNHFVAKITPLVGDKHFKELHYFGHKPGTATSELSRLADKLIIYLGRDQWSEDDVKIIHYHTQRVEYRRGWIENLPSGASVLYDVSCCDGIHNGKMCENPKNRLQQMADCFRRNKPSWALVKYNSPNLSFLQEFLDSNPTIEVLRPGFVNQASFEVYLEWNHEIFASKRVNKIQELLERPIQIQMLYADWLQDYVPPKKDLPPAPLIVSNKTRTILDLHTAITNPPKLATIPRRAAQDPSGVNYDGVDSDDDSRSGLDEISLPRNSDSEFDGFYSEFEFSEETPNNDESPLSDERDKRETPPIPPKPIRMVAPAKPVPNILPRISPPIPPKPIHKRSPAVDLDASDSADEQPLFRRDKDPETEDKFDVLMDYTNFEQMDDINSGKRLTFNSANALVAYVLEGDVTKTGFITRPWREQLKMANRVVVPISESYSASYQLGAEEHEGRFILDLKSLVSRFGTIAPTLLTHFPLQTPDDGWCVISAIEALTAMGRDSVLAAIGCNKYVTPQFNAKQAADIIRRVCQGIDVYIGKDQTSTLEPGSDSPQKFALPSFGDAHSKKPFVAILQYPDYYHCVPYMPGRLPDRLVYKTMIDYRVFMKKPFHEYIQLASKAAAREKDAETMTDREKEIAKEASKVIAKSVIIGDPWPKFLVGLMLAGPGCRKTTEILNFMTQNPGCVYVASSRPMADEFRKALSSRVIGCYDRGRLGAKRLWVKTMGAAFCADRVEGYTPAVQGSVTHVIVDECFTRDIPYLLALQHVMKCNLIGAGDPRQLGVDPDKIDAPDFDVNEFDFKRVIPQFTAQHKDMCIDDFTFRFGMLTSRICNAINQQVHLKPVFLKRNRIVNLPPRYLDELKSSNVLIVTPSFKGWTDKEAMKKLISIRQAQGFSEPVVAIYLPNLKAVSDLFASLSQLFVALTRSEGDVIIVSEVSVFKDFKYRLDALAPSKSVSRRLVGGALIMPKEHEFDIYTNPVVPEPTIVKTTRLQRKICVPPGNWRNLVDYCKFHDQASLLSCVLPSRSANVSVNYELVLGSERTIMALDENTAGIRNWVSSHLQNIATVCERVEECSKSKSLRFPIPGDTIARCFVKCFLDASKLCALKEFNVLQGLATECRNEFISVVNFSQSDSDKLSLTLEQYLNTANEHLKSQVKMKGYEAIFSGKNGLPGKPKVGQPIVAFQKIVNAILGPFVRMLTKILQECTKPHVMFCNGFTTADVWASALAFVDWSLDFNMMDVSQMDASHNANSNDIIERIVDLIARVLGEVTKVNDLLHKVPVFAEVLRFYLTQSLASGSPPTWLWNVLKVCVNFVVAGLTGPYTTGFVDQIKWIAISGDDSVDQTLSPKVWNLNTIGLAYSNTLKILRSNGVFEFLNHIFSRNGYYYNPLTLTWKIMGRNFTQEVHSVSAYRDYWQAVNDMMTPYRHDYLTASIDLAAWFNCEPAEIENLIQSLEDFLLMTQVDLSSNLKTYTAVDYLCGGVIMSNKQEVIIKSKNPSTKQVKKVERILNGKRQKKQKDNEKKDQRHAASTNGTSTRKQKQQKQRRARVNKPRAAKPTKGAAEEQVKEIMRYLTTEDMSSIVLPTGGNEPGVVKAELHASKRLSFNEEAASNPVCPAGQTWLAYTTEPGMVRVGQDYSGGTMDYGFATLGVVLDEGGDITAEQFNLPYTDCTVWFEETNVDVEVPMPYAAPNPDFSANPLRGWGEFCPAKRTRDLTDGHFYYLDQGMEYVVALGAVASGFTLTYTLWLLDAKANNMIPIAEAGLTPDSTTSIAVPESGWYKITFAVIADTGKKSSKTLTAKAVRGKLTHKRLGAGDEFGSGIVMNIGVHCSGKMVTTFDVMPNLFAKILTIDSYCTHTVRDWQMNTSPDIEAQGSIVTALIPTGDYWWQITSYERIAALGRMGSTEELLQAKSGQIGFVPLTQSGELVLKTDFDIKNGQIWDSFVPIFPRGVTKVINIDAGTDADGHSWTTKDFFRVAYFTSDSWAPLCSPNVPEQAVDLALQAVSKMPFAAANDSHVLDTISNIAEAADSVMSIASMFML